MVFEGSGTNEEEKKAREGGWGVIKPGKGEGRDAYRNFVDEIRRVAGCTVETQSREFDISSQQIFE